MMSEKLGKHQESERKVVNCRKTMRGGTSVEKASNRGARSTARKHAVGKSMREESVTLPNKGLVMTIGSNVSSAFAVKKAAKSALVTDGAISGGDGTESETTGAQKCKATVIASKFTSKKQVAEGSTSDGNYREQKRENHISSTVRKLPNIDQNDGTRVQSMDSDSDDSSKEDYPKTQIGRQSSSEEEESDIERSQMQRKMAAKPQAEFLPKWKKRCAPASSSGQSSDENTSASISTSAVTATAIKKLPAKDSGSNEDSAESRRRVETIAKNPTRNTLKSCTTPSAEVSSFDDSSNEEAENDSESPSSAEEPRKVRNRYNAAKEAKCTPKGYSAESSSDDHCSEVDSVEGKAQKATKTRTVAPSKRAKTPGTNSLYTDGSCHEEEEDGLDKHSGKAHASNYFTAKRSFGDEATTQESKEGGKKSTKKDKKESTLQKLPKQHTEIKTADRKRKSDGAADLSSKKRPHVDDNSHQPKGDEQRTVFCGGLPIGSTEGIIKEVFEESCGVVEYVKVLGNGGACFVCFEHDQSVAEAVKWHGSDYKGKALKINKASDKPLQKRQTPKEGCQVFVRNLSFKSTENSIRSAFSECGAVIDVWLPTGDDGRLRGFCKVTFDSENGAKAACEWTNTDLDGRTITVEMARPRGEAGDRRPRGGASGRGRVDHRASIRSGEPRNRRGDVSAAKKAEKDGTIQEFVGKTMTFDSDSGGSD